MDKYCFELKDDHRTERRIVVVLLILILSFFAHGTRIIAQEHYEVKFGTVRFHSGDGFEEMHAHSNKLKGSIDIKSSSFSFKVPLNTFRGFNCPLLNFFFRSNRMETNLYTDATFIGHILDEKDLSRDGDYYIRAKGKMTVYGKEQYVFIKVHVVSKDGKLNIDTSLPITFEDYDIRIPKILKKETVKEVTVDVTATLVRADDLSMK